MSIDQKHPLYSEFILDWRTMRDVYRGERLIKDRSEIYLPPTAGMVLDGMGINQLGRKAYEAYKLRSVFPDYVRDAVQAMIGIMHSKPPVIELPSALEPIRENATITGESLPYVLRRLNEQQLITGRAGMLLDLPLIPDQASPLPNIFIYKAEDIINWDDGLYSEYIKPQLNLVVLNESSFERSQEYAWTFVEKYRVLVLGDPSDSSSGGVYSTGLLRNKRTTITLDDLAVPSIRGKSLTEIPFVFINSKDVVTSPDDPPLLGLAKLSLAIYRGEADYRQNLFMQGQDTLVVTGIAEDALRVGSGATINLPIGGDAKYIGVTATGLSEQRQAIENDKQAALHKAGQLMTSSSGAKESGEALKIRVAAQTATLNQIALAGAEGLENLLRVAAVWVGANPDEVSVKPNLDFVNEELNSRSLVELMTAKSMGAPLSRKSIHKIMQDKNITEMQYDDEIEEIMEEMPLEEDSMSLDNHNTSNNSDNMMEPNAESDEDKNEEMNQKNVKVPGGK